MVGLTSCGSKEALAAHVKLLSLWVTCNLIYEQCIAQSCCTVPLQSSTAALQGPRGKARRRRCPLPGCLMQHTGAYLTRRRRPAPQIPAHQYQYEPLCVECGGLGGVSGS